MKDFSKIMSDYSSSYTIIIYISTPSRPVSVMKSK